MDPTVITAIATFFSALDGWTVGTIIICVFVVPPVLGFVAVMKVITAMDALKNEIRLKNQEDNKRFEAIVAMFNRQLTEFCSKYDNNIYLVKNWEKTAGDMTNLVYLNTQAITSLANKFDQLIGLWSADRHGR